MTVCLVDSCLQKQTAAILRTEAAEITFSVQRVQQQLDTNDCYVFAIVYLADLFFNSPADVHHVQFNVGDMRRHLRTSLLNSKFECLFPKTEGAQQKKKHRLHYDNIIIPVHCVCRMPHFTTDDEEKNCKWQNVIAATVGFIGAVFLSLVKCSKNGINYGFALIVFSMSCSPNSPCSFPWPGPQDFYGSQDLHGRQDLHGPLDLHGPSQLA